MRFSYYYGIESEQFRFYKIPKILFTEDNFKKLSNDAKLLYGLMLDRMALSRKNGWIDDENRVYIYYTLENIMEDLNLGKTTCVKILAELDAVKGIGLIEKKKQGFGKPDIIYVKNFITSINDCNNQENLDFDRSSKNETPEVQKMNYDNFKKQTSCVSQTEPFVVQKLNTNNTNINNEINTNNTNLSSNHMMDVTEYYLDLIRSNLDMDTISCDFNHGDYNRYLEMYHLICDVVCVPRDYIRVNNYNYPYEIVKSRFILLTKEHLMYVMYSMDKTNNAIGNIRNYLISSLYNSVDTLNNNMQHMINIME